MVFAIFAMQVSILLSGKTKKMFFDLPLYNQAQGSNSQRNIIYQKKDFDSFVLVDQGKIYIKSTAGLRVYGKLPWIWKWTQIFWIVPKFIRDAVYDYVARNRYKWFGKKDQCVIPSAEVRSRFLD